ncbi:hypothetical protein [Flavobacterium foetidum]|uniref:hypothetical protein n=1 Tax=Flavobacterium foetidum TaxID=2026681 RepID=UPI001074D2B2|nr:hypothetical protein [Flavobacterium foetidum]KAF2507462.1 hypothetical protein E0W73_20345 [Flavobacterium foetidum]
MKKQILLSGFFMFLISCGKIENSLTESQNLNRELLTQNEVDAGRNKNIQKLLFKNTDEIHYSEELNVKLLSKVADNLKVKYSDIKINESSSIDYNEKTAFFVVTIVEHGVKNEEALGDYFQRKYLFVDKEDGTIIAEEFDDNLGYYDNEGIRVSKTYILKNLVSLNENLKGIAFYTEVSANSRIVLYSERKFTILALADNEIKKILYEYPIRLTNGDSNGSGTFQLETLETGISLSEQKTNGFCDLLVTKQFSYEEAIEADLENGIEEKNDLKTKKEFEKLRFNGREYVYARDDRHRFLD